jgi:phage shock protein PspC (stress-responsive transcriptional regulator)
MSLFLATLLPGLFLALLGGTLFWSGSRVASMAKALPRSNRGAWLFFGAGAAWFLWRLSHLNESDLIFFKTPGPVMIGFGVLAGLAFIYTPDFLAVRGLCVLMLLAAEPLLSAAYMEYQHPQRLLMVSAVYAGLALAIYLAAAPYRLRDFFEWLFQRPARVRLAGATLLAYGLATAAAAFTY